MRFIPDTTGFTGAEKALIVTFGMALTGIAGSLIRGGSAQAGQDARGVLLRGTGAVGAMQSPAFGAPPGAELQQPGAFMKAGRIESPGGGPPQPPPWDGCGQPSAPAGAGPGGPPAPVVQNNAPLVYLHGDEQFQPMSAQDFVNHSELRWTHDGCRDASVAKRCAVDTRRLGQGGYSERTSNGLCMNNGDTYSSADNTRPYEGDAGIGGFFLDLDNDHRKGGAPAELPDHC